MITEPGLYPDISHTEYVADPVEGGSLSSTGARRILSPGCPAKFRWDQDHGEPPKAEFDFGSAAHRLVLNSDDRAGAKLAVLGYKDWRTADAKAAKAEARENGLTPILAKDFDTVESMAQALREHPFASLLLTDGLPEQTIVWRDMTTGVMCRARLDWLRNRRPGHRLIIPDYKTARSAEPGEFARAAASYGYPQQADFYMRGLRALGICGEHDQFVFIVQEKEPPYIVSVLELDTTAMAIGQVRNNDALRMYRECRESGRWPGYSEDVELISLPRWYELSEGFGE